MCAGFKPRPPRIAVHYQAVLTEADGCRVNVVITNISRDGFHLDSGAELEAGEEVSLHIPKSNPVRARIRWTRGREAGGTFLESVAL